MTKQICILGIGNTSATDDGIPSLLIERLRLRYRSNSLPNSGVIISFASLPFLDASLFNVMSECEILILIDTIVAPTTAGTVHKHTYKTSGLSSDCIEWPESQGIGICEMLGLAMALNRLPASLVFWNVDVISRHAGFQPSSELLAMLPTLETQLYQELQELALT
jgi:hydrogenase maturation protease